MKLDGDMPKGKRSMIISGFIIILISAILFLIDIEITEYISTFDNCTAPAHILILKSILDNAIAGALIAFILAIFYRSIIKLIDHERVIEISPGEIGNRLFQNTKNTTRYILIGNTATFFSSSILPIICDNSKTKTGTTQTKLFIIDPRDNSSIRAYLSHKTRLSFKSAQVSSRDLACWVKPKHDFEIENEDQVLSKIYACIYFCAYASKVSGIEINLFLRKSFTALRVDMSDDEVVLTQESKTDPAVAFSSKGDFYGWYFKESESLEQQCDKISLSNNPRLMRLFIAPPSSAKAAIEESLRSLIINVFNDKKFALKKTVIELTVNRIISPTHSY